MYGARKTISGMVHAWFSKDKTDRTTYGAKAIFLRPYVEDGLAEKTLARYLEEDPTKRRKLKPLGQSLKGRPRTLTESEKAVVIDVVQKTDEQNNGMTNRELVTIISDMRPGTITIISDICKDFILCYIKLVLFISQAFPLSLELSNKQCYLAMKSMQKEGYARGQFTKRTVKVQGTTYMRTMVSARGMMRWHYQLEEVTKFLEEKNQPQGLWKELSPHG
jgi:hypothetical protein